MDFVNKLTGSGNNNTGDKQVETQQQESSGGFMDKVNHLAGGGAKGEQNEDGLDKGESSDILQPLVQTQLTSHLQLSITSKRSSSARAIRATRVPPSRPRTRPSPTSSATSTRRPPARSSSLRTRTRSTACKIAVDDQGLGLQVNPLGTAAIACVS